MGSNGEIVIFLFHDDNDNTDFSSCQPESDLIIRQIEMLSSLEGEYISEV